MVDVKKFLQDIDLSGAGIRGPKGPVAHPIIGKSVNPIQTEGGQIMPTITTAPPKFFTFRHHWEMIGENSFITVSDYHYKIVYFP